MKKIKVKCNTGKDVEWQNIKSLQGCLKKISAESMKKLKASIIENDFSFPFIVWRAKDGVLYSIDGVHRALALRELKDEGYHVDDNLPAVFVHANDKVQAKKLILLATSQYAKIQQHEFIDFITDLDILKLVDEIDIQGIQIFDDSEPTIKSEALVPYKHVHFLVSVPINKITEVQALIEKLSQIKDIEIEQGQN